MIPYGVSDFKVIRNEGLYYVDKTEYLAKLEVQDRFVFFVRPRRFGKSLFTSMLQCYYDRREAANFETLFGGLWIGAHPTPNRNRYMVLALDFSKAGPVCNESLAEAFAVHLGARLNQLVDGNGDVFDAPFREMVRAEKDVAAKYAAVVAYAKERGAGIKPWYDGYCFAKAADGIEKLRRYASDRFVPELARGTRLHLILFQFKGTELVRLEELKG